MRRFNVAVLVVASAALLALDGCASCDNMGQQWRAATKGIKRKVTLYSSSGTVIQEWRTDDEGYIEDSGSMIYFLDESGSPVMVQGTIVAEEIK